MKRNRNILTILFIIATTIILINPSKVLADGFTLNSATTEETDNTGNFGSMPSSTEMTDYCKTKLGINITASAYNRDTSISTNYVSPRKITITNNDGGKYRVIIYHGAVGTLGKLENLTKKEIDKYNDGNEDDSEEPDTIAVKTKNFSGESWSWNLPAGEEALVIVLNNQVKYSGNSYNGTCTEKNKNGKCTKYKEVKINCPKGGLKKSESTGQDAEITGNAASLFVENPSDTGLVKNLRVGSLNGTNACSLALQGKYSNNGKIVTDSEFNVSSEDYENYISNYYNKILSYCSSDYVAFNLDESKIRSLSNNLLKVFYYNNNLEKMTENSSFMTMFQLNNEINALQNRIKTLYPSNYSDHIIKNTNNLTKSLSCKYDKNSVNSNTEYIEDEYLYITDENKITAELSSGKTVKVCSTKCYEHLTVKYNPPETVKAGLCFQYKVTVKSVSNCGVEVNNNYWQEISTKDMCAPVAICSNNEKHTQAGPSEEFDNCIENCDSGKYSQSCINSCYKEVYTNNSDYTQEKTSNSENYEPSFLLNSTFDSNLVKVSDNPGGYTDNQLRNYYNSKKAYKNCRTTEKIKNNLDTCAEYFFYAKALYPYGKYNDNGTKWTSFKVIDKTAGKVISDTAVNIPMQIGRASPFYLRDIDSTKDLLRSLLGYTSNGIWLKYVINENGIKRQYSTRYVCKETCQYTGCELTEEEKRTGIVRAYTSSQYSDETISDLEAISSALSKCSASAACDTTETTTEFTIKINSKTENNNKETVETIPAVGTTTTGSTIGMSTDFDGDGDGSNDMFVAEEKNATGTGILGLCYNGTSTPHYQTTITYPGTYMNYKNGKRLYTSTNDSSYYYKKNYFCTPYNATEVNEKYWNWAINDKYDSNKYPSDFTPEYNITATLGNSNKSQRFGKYNWTIDFKCFYSLSNAICKCSTDHPECCPKDKCDSENSSHICNANFRVVDSAVLFPDENGKAITDESQLPFNWTSKAQDNDTIHNSKLIERGYRINPKEYRETLEKNASSAFDNNGTIAYHIYLDKDNINEIKNYVNTHGYTEYSGTYTAVEGITGLYYYTSTSVIENQTLVKDYSRNTELGYNK